MYTEHTQNMPVVTRAAAKAAAKAGTDLTGVKAVRVQVSKQYTKVWEYREMDLYTGRGRAQTPTPEVDHVLEVQLIDFAHVLAYGAVGGRAGSMAAAQAHAQIVDVLNSVINLNVTTKKINCAKRGPFTAAINRLNSNHGLRGVTLEQFARQGSARSLVDDGTWARIEGAIVNSYDATNLELSEADLLPKASELVQRTMDEVGNVLDRLGVH